MKKNVRMLLSLWVLMAFAAAAARAQTQFSERQDPAVIQKAVDDYVRVQIAGLRKALAAADGRQDWILTVPRLGYRLLASQAGPLPPVAGIPRLAVLPFADLGGDPDRAWFADGVVAEIVAALGRFRSFSVVALSSSQAYKGRASDVREVAAELGVRYLLEGTVRRGGDRLRITAELVDGESGAQLWSESLEGALDEVFDFQDRITAAVATVAEPRIHAAEIARSRRERPGSVATYDLYLRPLAAILAETEAGNAEAYALTLEGLGREPDDPRLLTLASWVLEHRTATGWPPFGPDDRARCGAFARAALARAGDDATLLARCAASRCCRARASMTGAWRCSAPRSRPIPTTSACWCRPASATCTAATSTRPSPSPAAPTCCGRETSGRTSRSA